MRLGRRRSAALAGPSITGGLHMAGHQLRHLLIDSTNGVATSPLSSTGNIMRSTSSPANTSAPGDNGGELWLWGPIPEGHEVRYKFELQDTGRLLLPPARVLRQIRVLRRDRERRQACGWRGPIPEATGRGTGSEIIPGEEGALLPPAPVLRQIRVLRRDRERRQAVAVGGRSAKGTGSATASTSSRA